MTVDLYGQCAQYDRITEICEQYGVALIEDAAEALGAVPGGAGPPARSAPSRRSQRQQDHHQAAVAACCAPATPPMPPGRGSSPPRHASRFPHYEHEVVGYNYRLFNLPPPSAVSSFARCRSGWQPGERCGSVTCTPGDLPGVTFMPNHPAGEPTNWLTVLTIDLDGAGATTKDVQRLLHEHEIESRPAWKPMHLQPVYRDSEVIGGSFSKRVRDGLCLPSGSNLTEAEQQRVIELVRSSIERSPRRPHRREGAHEQPTAGQHRPAGLQRRELSGASAAGDPGPGRSATFELVVSDDASSDRSAEIVADYAAKDRRVRLEPATERLGGSRNFNRVFALSRGRYFRWAAHDDLCAPTYLERCVELLEADPEVVMAHTEAAYIDARGKPIRPLRHGYVDATNGYVEEVAMEDDFAELAVCVDPADRLGQSRFHSLVAHAAHLRGHPHGGYGAHAAAPAVLRR
ncbi:MAG: DegT/DnrJ/EryC1/StrS family aminotransferase [Acidimicrobiales bacterium]